MVGESTLRVRVVCTDLPGKRFIDPQDPKQAAQEPVYLGIQRGRDVIDEVSADRPQVTFDAEFKIGERADGSPNFLGPFAQGTGADRFFYLSWGIRRPGGGLRMFRRLKIRLGHLRWPAIRRSMKEGKPLTVRLRLTDARGGPLCATPPKTHIDWDVP